MVIIGIDAHKRSDTAVIADTVGRQSAVTTIGTTSSDHLALLAWANKHDDQEPLWAIEDCRHLSRRLERDLLAAGEQVVRVPPKLMSHVRDSARTFGKSDPIDALAIARAALREPALPVARLDGAEREIRLLVDHREDLVAERSRVISRLRWHLRELDPAWAAPANFDRASAFARIKFHLDDFAGIIADLAQRLLTHLHRLTEEIDELTAELSRRIPVIALALLAIVGCGSLTAAKILGDTAGVTRFRSKDSYARHNGTAPLPVWSSNKARHRLSRTGNRQLNAALHRIALTQARCHPGARELLARRKAGGDGGMEALRILKRRLSDVVYRALIDDHKSSAAARSSSPLDRGAGDTPLCSWKGPQLRLAGTSRLEAPERLSVQLAAPEQPRTLTVAHPLASGGHCRKRRDLQRYKGSREKGRRGQDWLPDSAGL